MIIDVERVNVEDHESRLTFLVESFPAELTHERLVSRVDARVRVERGAAVEGFPALVTFVRFFLRHNRDATFQTCSVESGPKSTRTVQMIPSVQPENQAAIARLLTLTARNRQRAKRKTGIKTLTRKQEE